MPLKYTTISAELAEYADLAAMQARAEGYRLRAEPSDPYFPVSPTIQGSAAHRELIIEAVAKVSFANSKKWLAYGRAQSRETRVLIVAPPQKRNVAVTEIAKFQEAGIGLSVGAAGALVSLVPPRDLSTQILCPDISGDRPKVQRKLGPCFDKVRRGDTVDGFKDVAVIVETAARQRLLDGVSTGRITFASKTGKALSYSPKEIRRGTMGWLRERYGEIVKPNGVDNLIYQAFKAVGSDRNLASHNDLSAQKRRAMNNRIAKHLLVLHQAARELI